MNNLTTQEFYNYIGKLNGRKDDVSNNYILTNFIFANCNNVKNKVLRKEFLSTLILSTFTFEDVIFELVWKDNVVDETFISFQEII